MQLSLERPTVWAELREGRKKAGKGWRGLAKAETDMRKRQDRQGNLGRPRQQRQAKDGKVGSSKLRDKQHKS